MLMPSFVASTLLSRSGSLFSSQQAKAQTELASKMILEYGEEVVLYFVRHSSRWTKDGKPAYSFGLLPYIKDEVLSSLKRDKAKREQIEAARRRAEEPKEKFSPTPNPIKRERDTFLKEVPDDEVEAMAQEIMKKLLGG